MQLVVVTLCIVFILFLLIMHYENHKLTIKEYDIYSDKIPEEFNDVKIVLLTDLHNNSFGINNDKLIHKIDAISPDYVMIAGDMITSDLKNNAIAIDLLQNLDKKYPIYYSYGNHEQKMENYMDDIDKTDLIMNYKRIIDESNINLLRNNTIELQRGRSIVRITGLELPLTYYRRHNRPKFTKDLLPSLIGHADNTIYTILLAHNPMYFKEYTEWGADLTLSGHVHGGIVSLPYLGGVISPQMVLFPTYDAGLFKNGSSTMILSRGLGMHTIKIRIFNRPELAVIHLKRNN